MNEDDQTRYVQLVCGRHIIAISDIHGCDVALEAILNEVKEYDCQTVFLGDYLDRGPSSPRVIEILAKIKQDRADFEFLMGNHEAMFLEDIESGLESLGKNSAISQYRRLGGVPDDHLRFLKDLKPYHESESFIFVHAGIGKNPHLPIEEQPLEDILWTYRISRSWKGKTLVRGHQVVKFPEVHGNHINLDTACVFGGKLTAGIFDDVAGIMIGYVQASNVGEITTTVL